MRLKECEDKVCKCCGKPAEIWSQTHGQDKIFWCSHSCKLKIEELTAYVRKVYPDLT